MPLQVGLNLLTLVMCVITLTLATVALMPQITHGLRLARDGMLWAVLLGILGFVGFIGWGRLLKPESNDKPSEAASVLQELLGEPRTPTPQLDPLPLPTANSTAQSIRSMTTKTKSVRVVESTSFPLRRNPEPIADSSLTASAEIGLRVMDSRNSAIPSVSVVESGPAPTRTSRSSSLPFTANRSRPRRISSTNNHNRSDWMPNFDR